MKVRLTEWAAAHYKPAPSAHVLRAWVRGGQIHPAPELVGKTYYVEQSAVRQTATSARPSLVSRLQRAA